MTAEVEEMLGMLDCLLQDIVAELHENGYAVSLDVSLQARRDFPHRHSQSSELPGMPRGWNLR